MDHSHRPSQQSTLLDPDWPLGSRSHGLTQGGSKSRHSDYSPRRNRWELNADSIIEKLKANRTFKVGDDFNVEGLPILGDMTRYGVTEEEQFKLVSLEVRRLVDAINRAQPVRLESEAGWFGKADEDGYRHLDKLARQLSLSIAICVNDAELQMLEHCPHFSEPQVFHAVRGRLLAVFDPDIPRDPAQICNEMRLGEFNDEALHAVINYLTSIMSQVLLRTMRGMFWDDNCIIGMAKWAAKVKVVAMDLSGAASRCLDSKRDWVERMKGITAKEPNPEATSDKGRTAIGKQMEAMARSIVPRARRYFEVNCAFAQGLLRLLDTVIGAMGTGVGAALPLDVFEMCSVVYDMGFRGKRSIMCQERDGSVSVSGSRGVVYCASFAFEVCLRALEDLKLRCGNLPISRTGEPVTQVYWKWTELRSEGDVLKDEMDIFVGDPWEGKLELFLMQDVITAFTPLAMVGASFLASVSTMTRLVMSIAEPGDPVSECLETRFLAATFIRTSKFDASIGDPNVTSVCACPIAEERALAQGPMSSRPRNKSMPDADKQLRRQLLEKNKAVAGAMEKANTWVLDSSSITMQYRWYCWATLAGCAALVLGGLAVGLSVNERIQGVDPFNISVFCWVLAGFIVLLMKYIRVESWPWSDFFQGRVVCRSLSEAVAVSGIPDQLLLTVLHLLEPSTMMNKVGPFQMTFMRKDLDAPGFQIDIPPRTESLADAGCFLVKVESSLGPALVVMRGHGTGDYAVVNPQGVSGFGSNADKCVSFRDPVKWGRGHEQKNMYKLCANELSWSRVVGIFWEDAYYW